MPKSQISENSKLTEIVNLRYFENSGFEISVIMQIWELNNINTLKTLNLSSSLIITFGIFQFC